MKKALLVLGILACIAGGVIGGIHSYLTADMIYAGKEVFFAEEEYTQFKMEVGRDEVRVSDISVLSFDPPIVVVYKVRTPHGYQFAYGDGYVDSDCVAPWMFVSAPMAILVVVLISIRDNEKGEGICLKKRVD